VNVHSAPESDRANAHKGETATAQISAESDAQGRHWGGPVIGGFYLSMGGVHLGLVAAETETYRHFADAGLFAFVRDGWQEIFMAQPVVFGLLLMAGETALGILLLVGGRWASVGWAGAIAFHLLLMLFGFGVWLWCIPALAALVALARKDASTIWSAAKGAQRRTT